MPLVIEMSQGHDVYVDDIKCVIEEVRNEYDFIVAVHNRDGVSRFRVTDEYLTEIMAGVKISAGSNINKRGTVKVAFEVPRQVSVVRGNLYRKGVRQVRKGVISL